MNTVQFNINLVLDEVQNQYLVDAAVARDVSRTQLIRRLVDVVLSERAFAQVLRDDDAPSDRTSGGRRRWPSRKSVYVSKPKMEEPRRTRERPADKTEEIATPRQYDPDARHPLLNLRRGSTTIAPRSASARTRAEMEADLRTAIINTGGVLVDG